MEGLDDTGRGAGLLVGDVDHGGDLRGNGDRAEAGTEDDQAGHQSGRVGAVGVDAGEQEESGDVEHGADGHDRPCSEAGDQRGGHGRPEDGGTAHGQELHSRAQRRVAAHLLQEDRGQEEHRQEGGTVERERATGRAERAGPKQP